jgi:hypothetical protein
MSTRGVMKMTIDTLARTGGQMSAGAYQKIIDYAKENGLTDGEKSALLDLGYLKDSRILSQAGVRFDAIVFDAQAVKLAQDLGRVLGIAPKIPGGNNGGNVNPPPAGDALAQAKQARDAAVGKGAALGSFDTWKLQTSGADITFHVEVQGQKFPAFVLDKPVWKDPGARDVVAENAAKLAAVTTLGELDKLIGEIAKKEKDYFDAKGVQAKFSNELYGIQNQRRAAFFGGIEKSIGQTRLPIGDRAKVGLILKLAPEKMVSGRAYTMETGSHTNYWPYWDNYAEPVKMLLDQLEKGTDEWHVVKNRLADIYRRKSVFSWGREVNERDFEESLGAALVYNPQYSSTFGHRVSLKAGSTAFDPKYEILTVKTAGLPDNLKEYAGAQVVRGTDGALTFDFMGEDAKPDRTGKKVPDALKQHITSKDVAVDDIGIRPLANGETARSNISADWDQNGGINVARILIGWWGHCHNESPLNAAGVDPQKDVSVYTANRKVDSKKALKTYDPEQVWDVAGQFAADHESDYTKPVEKETFVGERNNGGHWFYIGFDDNARRIRIDAEVTELWHRGDPNKQYDDPMSRFRRDIENPDGTFSPNPDWVASNAREDDSITVDAKGRKMGLKTKYITFDQQGDRYEKEEQVVLDPTKDQFVKLADEISSQNPDGGGKMIEHWYNAKTNQYQQIAVEVTKGNNFARKEIKKDNPKVAKDVLSEQETVYDSVIAIHNFVMKDPGLPFTFDTSSGMSVWNYPVKTIQTDVEKTTEKVENGKTFTYTTYRLQYSTMGGPSGDVRYIIKRDETGEPVRAIALDPMPDFAFRYDRMVCGPVAPAAGGDMAINKAAYYSGYMTDRAKNKIVPTLWEKLATVLYAGLSDKTPKEGAYVFEKENGELLSFNSKAEFDAAVKADLKVRELEGAGRNIA